MRFVSTRHGTLYYTVMGEGRPLMLIHGNTMTAASQHRLAQKFTDEHQVISIDLLGHGHSARPPDLFTTRYFAIQGESLADLLQHLFPTSSVPIFGMSAGAMSAMHAVCDASKHIAALILDGVFSTVGPETLEAHRTNVNRVSPTWERYMRSQHGADWWPQLLDGLMHVIEQMAEHQISTTPCLGDIHIPTLLFQGGRDRFCPEHQGRAVAAAIPGTRFIYDSAAGHILAWKYPCVVREIVRDFLSTQ